MIAYVESNFLLELALGQAEAPFADEILTLAEGQHVDLAYPMFSLSEPFSTVTQRTRERERIASLVSAQLKELGRSAPHLQLVAALQHVPGALSGVGTAELDLLERAAARLLTAARGLITDSISFQRALAYQRQYGLQPADAVIYAAIIVDLERQRPELPKVFISRNWKDFRDPSIPAELHSHNCRFEESFESGLAFIRDSALGV